MTLAQQKMLNLHPSNWLQTGSDGAVVVAEEGSWEARCVLLLWLAILVLVPFDLDTIDSRCLPATKTLCCSLEKSNSTTRSVLGSSSIMRLLNTEDFATWKP